MRKSCNAPAGFVTGRPPPSASRICLSETIIQSFEHDFQRCVSTSGEHGFFCAPYERKVANFPLLHCERSG